MVVTADGLLIAGIIEVVNGPLVLRGEGRGVPEGFLPAVIPAHFGLEILNFQLQDILHQGEDIRIVIIKGIAVDGALLCNILNGDLVQGPLVQQLDKCQPDGVFGVLGHDLPPCVFPISFHYTRKQRRSSSVNLARTAGGTAGESLDAGRSLPKF